MKICGLNLMNPKLNGYAVPSLRLPESCHVVISKVKQSHYRSGETLRVPRG
jgi:hypothetical protein